MKKIYPLGYLSMFLVFFGCASMQVATDVQRGRVALMIGKPQEALTLFQQAAQVDPNYIPRFSIFREGVWTYIGRAYYDTERLPEARQALERARSQYSDDLLAQLYLGLTLARDGDRQRGLKEVEGGMKGVYDWLEYTNFYRPEGPYWDPAREIRSQIQSDLALISSRETDWQRVIASGEWLGKRMEEEIDRAARDEKFWKQRDGGRSQDSPR